MYYKFLILLRERAHKISETHETRRARWYFGGVSSAAAICVTHPLDLLKVHLQTQQEEKLGLIKMVEKIYQHGGISSFYNGISAAILKQLTYTAARFGIYEVGKNYMNTETFLSKLQLAATAGLIGGFLGVPTDLVNVRMQNDVKFPLDKRRNYKHVFDGLWRVYKEEGAQRLFTGGASAISRSILVTMGQIAVYDQVKSMLLLTPWFHDNVVTFLSASTIAGCAATIVAHPFDVIKTRLMNAKPGEYRSLFHVISYTALNGLLAFYKGFLPALARLGPQTVLTFLLLEQMRLKFGYIESKKI